MIGEGYDTYGWTGRIPFGGCETLVYGYVAVVGRATGALVDGGEIGGRGGAVVADDDCGTCWKALVTSCNDIREGG